MVLFRGQIMGFVDADNATREALGRMMPGRSPLIESFNDPAVRL